MPGVNTTPRLLSSRAGRALVAGGAPDQAGSDLAWAWFNLGAAGMGRTIVGLLASRKFDQLSANFDEDWDILKWALCPLPSRTR